ncbi:4Fe-4S dicluster domain-containing protein [Clostridium botulinum]|uniref:4Fe-4S dicluster domain-containing protein n=1 Tax=Clostridium botulinum TaxID=1491 RepID=A0A846J9I5_CLOBO|nr:[Fe-Fe] hydrogenase large subunit C-terminal domain-containing protein [Clostridium botulinum]ACA55303.1 sensory box-containing [Fe] hydrogenase [Clostridium botulinum A3 str. Loch Maree]NFH66964.1 4Fe-4S dicluster domain-containing protein [Clostridium botulinum]NFJ10529.1 4Fe-4S dicluster domain-containing protein [Clostridium botulinum]NFK15219.1 4Fe-4S dicluster domain-containing protein [Clostridium botulinum]NFM95875.1 4Fe-4S dicluster domain-containing protein [Clostridium botulinum]
MDYINFKKANCKNCYKCLRSCPVKAIKFKNHQAKIEMERCILCSRCVLVCPQNARKVVNYLDKVKKALNEKKKIVASIAPSFMGNFNVSYGKIIASLKTLGIKYAEETALGADMTTRLYKSFLKENKQDYYITTACPSLNLLVEKYYPELVKYMLPFMSPMVCHGKILKKVYGKDSFTLFIGPCTSKKAEHENYNFENSIDAVLTYEEYLTLLKENNISMENLEPLEFDNRSLELGSYYPITGGIISNLKDELKDKNIKSFYVDGVYACMDIFESIKKGHIKNSFIEASACVGSCIGGPEVITNNHEYYNKLEKVQNYIEDRQNYIEFYKNKTSKQNDLKNFNLNFHRGFVDKSINKEIQYEEEIKNILKSMGKYSKEDELNCGVCGYNTCIDKANAILEGMAEPDMCLHFMRSKAENISNIIFENTVNCIITVDDKLNIIEINPAAEKTFMLEKSLVKNKPINFLISEEDFVKVKESKNNILGKKVTIHNYGLVFIESIIFIEKQNIFLLSLTDITEKEKNKKKLKTLKESSFSAAEEVIEKQMRVAQEIASLLGETTAETKITLTKLKRIVESSDED